MIINVSAVLLCATLAAGMLEVRPGLLDRLVQYYKRNFLQDLADVASVQVNVSIQRAPPGYIDSSAWDYESVVRLIDLIRNSEANLPMPVRRALQEFLTPVPSRRYGGHGFLHKARQRAAAKFRRCMGDPTKPGYPKDCPRGGVRRHDKLKHSGRKNSIDRLHVPSFPNTNDLYYDDMIAVGALEDPEKLGPIFGINKPYNASLQDDDIVVISNPVEAKLPTGHISIGILRRILEARAEAARVMPTRPTTTMNIAFTNKTTAGDSTGGEDNTTDTGATGTGDTGGTGGTGGTGEPGDGAGAGGETTVEAAAAEEEAERRF